MIIIPFIIVDIILIVYQNYAFTRAQCYFGLTVCVFCLFFVFAFIVIMWGECDFFPV